MSGSASRPVVYKVEQGLGSWWGMGSLLGLAQVQTEFMFLFQPASSPHTLKEERQVSVS